MSGTHQSNSGALLHKSNDLKKAETPCNEFFRVFSVIDEELAKNIVSKNEAEP
ncbi:MAG: hypothetical protein LBE09_04825 [Christensenellaceae bacterium]|nr:hypothetical protein [Christensenellaceae bacterium]